MEKGSTKTGRTGTQAVPLVPQRVGVRQSKGQCRDIVPLCGDLSLSFFYTCRGGGHHSLAQGTGPALLPPYLHAGWFHPLHEKRLVSPVNSSGTVVRSGTPYSSLRKTICLAFNTTLLLFEQRLFKLLLKYCAQTSIMAGIHRNNAPH